MEEIQIYDTMKNNEHITLEKYAEVVLSKSSSPKYLDSIIPLVPTSQLIEIYDSKVSLSDLQKVIETPNNRGYANHSITC